MVCVNVLNNIFISFYKYLCPRVCSCYNRSNILDHSRDVGHIAPKVTLYLPRTLTSNEPNAGTMDKNQALYWPVYMALFGFHCLRVGVQGV